MIVVSDTSPLGSLALIDHLWLLKNIYGTVIIPKVVANELNAAQDTRIQNILNLEWIQIQSLGDPTIAENLRQSKNLDLGEAYAIALAVQLKADELLIDERIGRREAQHYGLSVIGLLGVLVIAKQRNLIFKVQPVMNALINQAGFRVSVQLYNRILSLSREDQNP
jgi:predicted nucleic acid-binding protein